MLAIYKREMRSYFTSPIGYIFMAIFLAVSGILFSICTVQAGENSNVGNYFVYLMISFFILLPLLTMKLFADERKQRTEVLLLTSPVTLSGMVCAKFLAAFSMFLITFFISSFDFIALYVYSADKPNTAILFGNSIGIILVSAAFIAIGVFISALTENQLVSALGTMATILVFIFSSIFNVFIDNYVLRTVLSWFSMLDRYTNFTYGYFDVNALIYFVSVCVIFLFLTVRVYEKRRWA